VCSVPVHHEVDGESDECSEQEVDHGERLLLLPRVPLHSLVQYMRIFPLAGVQVKSSPQPLQLMVLEKPLGFGKRMCTGRLM